MHWDYYGQRWASDPPSRVASNVAESRTPSVDAQVIAAYGLQLPIIWRTQVSDGQDDPDFTGQVAQIYGAGAFPEVSDSLSWPQADSAPTTATQSGPVTITSTGRASVPATTGEGINQETGATAAVVGVGTFGLLFGAGAAAATVWLLYSLIKEGDR